MSRVSAIPRPLWATSTSMSIRFIAINDNYDSLNSQSRDGMLVPIKSIE